MITDGEVAVDAGCSTWRGGPECAVYSLMAKRLAPWSKNLKVAGSRLHRDLI